MFLPQGAPTKEEAGKGDGCKDICCQIKRRKGETFSSRGRTLSQAAEGQPPKSRAYPYKDPEGLLPRHSHTFQSLQK